MNNVLIVDDHKLFAMGVAEIVERMPAIKECQYCNNGLEALKILRSNSDIKLVITDIEMPEMNGIELSKEIKTTFESIKVLVVSMFEKEGFIQQAIKYGVDGYLLKHVDPLEFERAISALLRDETYFGQDVMNKILPKMRAYGITSGIELTDSEKSILKLMSEGLTAKEISDKLFLSKNTIDTYRKILIEKFNARNSPHLIKLAFQLGYLHGE